ncbi:MAG TPA: hypothetical protein VIX87_02495 [Steroidobacteraceae bacterium]
MNCKLTDAQIVDTWQRLGGPASKVSGRALRFALKQQYGAAGKTERVFALWRSLRAPAAPPQPLSAALEGELRLAEQGRAAALEERDRAISRAQRSEARELAHQDRWANEIYALRESLEQLKGERARRLAAEGQVLRLQQELQVLRAQRTRG